MAGFTEGIKVFFGGDTSQLRSSLSEANSLVDGFTKTVKKAGLDLGRGFGFGVLIFQAKQFFDAVINDAQKTRDAFEEMGKPVPSSVASVARLADEVDRLKKGALELGTSFLGFIAKAGEGLGMLINRIRGVSREQEKLYEQIERDAEKQEKKRDDMAKNASEKRKAREERDRRLAEQAGERSDREREKRMDEEYENLVKVGKAQTELDDAKKKALYEQMSLSSKITADEKEKISLSKQIADYKKNENLSANDQLKVVELESKLLEANVRLYENRKDLAKETLKIEKEAAEQLKIQGDLTALNTKLYSDFMAQMMGFTDTRDFTEASDGSLQEVVRRNRSQIEKISQVGFSPTAFNGNQADFFNRTKLQNEIIKAEKELAFRDRIRQDAAIGGKALARTNFAGDPLLFDRVFDQIVKGQSVQERALSVNEEILAQLKYRGIVTVPLGGSTG